METSATEHAERNLVEKMNTINTFGFILRLMLFALTQLQIGGQLFAEAGGDCWHTNSGGGAQTPNGGIKIASVLCPSW